MSYDTTVRDALDPPSARIREDVSTPLTTRRWRWAGKWRPVAAAGVSICTLFLVTWVVAILTTPENVDRTETSEAAVSTTLEELVEPEGD